MVIALCILGVCWLIRKLMQREKQARVQIAEIDLVNGEAERNIRMTQGGATNLGSSMGRNLRDFAYLRLYQLDKNYCKLKVRVPSQYLREINAGDIGLLRYRGNELISFEKTGSVQSEDDKKVKFQV